MTEAEEYDKKLLERISMFSDAVYAIVLTILVLELHIPELVHPTSLSEMMEGLREISPKHDPVIYSFFNGEYVSFLPDQIHEYPSSVGIKNFQ